MDNNQQPQSSFIINALRWLLVLPGAIVAALLASIVLHSVVTLGFGPDKNIALSRESREWVEQLLTGLINGFTFVYVGALIVPSRRLFCAVALAVVLFFAVTISIIVITGRSDMVISNPSLSIASFVLAIIGVSAAIWATARDLRAEK